MRQLPILKFIKNQLTEERVSFVPGIGTFVIVKSSAKLSTDGSELDPPKTTIYLDHNRADVDHSILDYISLHLKGKKLDLVKQVDQYIQQVDTEISSKSYASMTGFGRLFKAEQGHFKFEQTAPEYLWVGADLPSLKLKRVDKPFVPVATFNRTEEAKTEDDFSYWIPFILTLLLLLTFAYKYYSVDTVYKADVVTEKVTEDAKDDNTTTQSEESSSSDALNDNAEEGVVTLITDSTSSTEAEGMTECIIITGTFSKPVHALKMMSKVEDKGYELYTEEVNDMTRVGLVFNCRNKDLKDYIYKIRKDINKDSWYLVPEITIY